MMFLEPHPQPHLPSEFRLWEEIAHDLPKLLGAGRVRNVLDGVRPLDPGALFDEAQLRAAMLKLSFLGHAYVWGGVNPVDHLPAGIAVPWFQVAKRLGRPPVLSYASYVLDNWQRLDPRGPIELGNIAVQQNFLGGLDENWFILVHVDIEAKAAPALGAITRARQAVKKNEPDELMGCLDRIASAIDEMRKTLQRMPEACDPYIYYHRVRPYIHGWKDHPALPRGLVYEGVEEYRGQPQQFCGESGAQSSIVPSLDAVLGIGHHNDTLLSYLLEMRRYMPPNHRTFIEVIERGPSVRQYVLDHESDHSMLRNTYNTCIHNLESFRSIHLEFAETYVRRQIQREHGNPIDVGTGGTPLIPYLKKHRDETRQHTIG